MTPLRRLAALLRPYRGRLAAAALLSAVAGAGTGAYAFLAGPALRTLVQGGGLDVGPTVRALLPQPVAAALEGLGVGVLPLLLVAAALVRAAASALSNALLPGAIARAAADLRAKLYARLLRADPSFFLGRPTGDLVSRASGDVAAAESAGTLVVTALVKDVAQALALLATCILLDARLALAAAVVIPAVVVPVKRFADRLRLIGAAALEAQGRLLRRAEQMLAGHRIVQAYGAEARERARLAADAGAHLAVMRTSLLWRSAFTPVLELVGVGGLAALLAYAGRGVAAGTMPAEDVISFAAAAYLLYQPLKALGNVGQHVAALRSAAGRAFELLDAPDAIADAPRARDLPAPSEIRLEGVTVRYGARAALDRVDLVLRAGETVALVGESGAGKSTVASLLLRQLDPAEGRVTFDGVDLREGTLASIRRHVGYVPQESTVFAGTVRFNVACGAALSDDAVRAALAEAGLASLVERLPGGLDAELGERGQELSGGERQRLGIARALARGARLLLLDEATASLDAASDAHVLDAFRRALSGGRIGLTISHRLASLAGVDRVVVLEAGHVVEEGTAEELLRGGGRFGRLFSAQLAVGAAS